MLYLDFLFYRSFDRENLGKISEKQFVDLLKSKDDIGDEEIKEMLAEYYRYCIFMALWAQSITLLKANLCQDK